MPRPVVAAILLAALAAARPAPAAPLDLLPAEATLVVAAERPRALAELARDLPAYQAAAALPAVREVLDSSPARRFYQFVAYAEKELGKPWPDLLDRVAGGGVALGVRLGDDPAPTLLVTRGTDEPTVAAAYGLFLRVVGDEAARQGGAVRTGEYHGVPTARSGDDLFAARVGRAVFVSNREDALAAGLDLALGRAKGKSAADRPGPPAARKLLAGDPLAWGWFDLAAAKQNKGLADFLANVRKDVAGLIVLGSTADAIRRADYIAFGLDRTAGGLAAAVRLPVKRADLPAGLALHAPPAGQPGSRPLIEPPGVVYSQSFYLDLGTLWRDRAKLLSAEQLKAIEKGERDISRVTPGTSVGKILEQSGPYHRVVVANVPGPPPYRTAPAQVIPPFAVVSSMREPAFGKAAASALRAAGFAGAVRYGLAMTEEKFAGVTVVSYRFPEKGADPGDPENSRFNFVPAFAVVGDSVVVGSRPELVKALLPGLAAAPAGGSPAVWRARGYGPGAADLLRANPDPTVTAAILSDGVGLAEARRQTEALAAWVRGLGATGLSFDHAADWYEVRFEWNHETHKTHE